MSRARGRRGVGCYGAARRVPERRRAPPPEDDLRTGLGGPGPGRPRARPARRAGRVVLGLGGPVRGVRRPGPAPAQAPPLALPGARPCRRRHAGFPAAAAAAGGFPPGVGYGVPAPGPPCMLGTRDASPSGAPPFGLLFADDTPRRPPPVRRPRGATARDGGPPSASRLRRRSPPRKRLPD